MERKIIRNIIMFCLTLHVITHSLGLLSVRVFSFTGIGIMTVSFLLTYFLCSEDDRMTKFDNWIDNRVDDRY